MGIPNSILEGICGWDEILKVGREKEFEGNEQIRIFLVSEKSFIFVVCACVFTGKSFINAG